MLLDAALLGVEAAAELLSRADGAGCCAPPSPFGSRKMTMTAAISAITRAAEMTNPGLVNGFRSVLFCVDSLMMNLRVLG
jgi:hypothetical protein